jgi:alcohol dehydrogenase class IV
MSAIPPFSFATAGEIRFGRGAVATAPQRVTSLGKRALLVTGSTGQRAVALAKALADAGVEVAQYRVSGEPTVEVALAGVDAARDHGSDVIIGLGGGSVIDTGKAIAALLTNPGSPFDYLEVVGKGQPLTAPAAPYVAIPTTAGAGAEVTRNAVLKVSEQAVKVSLRSPLMLPKLVIVDPELTDSMPPGVTASTGLDALTQVMEPFVSHLANPLTDAFCREGIARAARSLRRAYEHGDDTAAREDMALVGLLGGLALANAKLGAVHGFAGPLGGMYDIPHGIICARLLPFVMETNVAALQARRPDSPSLARYDELARLVTGDPRADARAGVAWVQALCDALDVPPLGQYGIEESAFPEIVEKSQRASSMKGNPLPLTEAELTRILAQAVG